MGYDEVKIGKGMRWGFGGVGEGFWMGFYLFSSY